MWQGAIAEKRLVVVSSMIGKTRRPTARLAAARNLLVVSLADEALIPFATAGGKTERLARQLVSDAVRLLTFGHSDTRNLVALGAEVIDEHPIRSSSSTPGPGEASLFS
jgi:hypothetical protein